MAGSGFEHRSLSDYERLVAGVQRGLRAHPPPPLSDEMRTRLQAIIASTAGRDHELLIWRLRLYCGHLAERTAHGSHLTLHAAFMNRATCPTCGSESTIVAAKPLRYAAAPPKPATPARKAPMRPRRPTRAELEKRVAQLERENERLRAQR
jgi:hypothetical protein